MSTRRLRHGQSSRDRRLRLGIVGCVPPTPTGPADFVAHLLPYLSRYADLDLFTDQPGSVPAGITGFADVHHVDERADHGCDLLIYHVANNEYQAPSIDAALAGPPGLLTLHDVSQHHLVEYRFLGHGQAEKYRRVLRAAHGEAGAALADLRSTTPVFDSERFLFDCLRPLLRRHRGAVVHSTFAGETVARRDPDLPLFTMPHFAMPVPPAVVRSALGLDESKLVIGHFGYVTRPKRPILLLRAFAQLLHDGAHASLLFAGQAEQDTGKEVLSEIERLGLQEHVGITGYLTEERMNSLVQAVDVVISFRWPQTGESSGSVALALAAGRALVVQRMGSWAELPTDVVMDAPVGDMDVEVAGLLRALKRLEEPLNRRALGDAARRFAQTELSVDLYARRLVGAAREVIERHPVPPSGVRESRQRSVLAYMAAHTGRGLDDETAVPDGWERQPREQGRERLRQLPPAGHGERLLAVGVPDVLLAPMSEIWGYEVVRAPADAAHLPFRAGHFHVVAYFDPPGDAGRALAACFEFNRVLCGQGVILLIDKSGMQPRKQLEGILREAGFAPEPLDPSRAATGGGSATANVPDRDRHVSVRARKLSLPGLTANLAAPAGADALSLPRLSVV